MRVEITDIDGAVRQFDAEAGQPVVVEPGDHIRLPDVGIDTASLQVTDGDVVTVAVGDEVVALQQLYQMLDAELDVELAFGAGDAVDSLGGLLTRLADQGPVADADASAQPSDILYVVGDVIEDPTALSSDELTATGPDESLSAPDLIDEEDVVFVDAEGHSDAADDGPFHGGEALTLADVLDFGDSTTEIAMEVLLAGSRPDADDEFSGYFAPVAMAGGQFIWTQMSGDGEFEWGPPDGGELGTLGPAMTADDVGWVTADGLAVDLNDLAGPVDGADAFWLV